LHDLRTQNAAHEATIKQLDESLCDIKRLLSTRGGERRVEPNELPIVMSGS
ncbi:hypothetical protein Pmar_PMAR002008, partial [Perkinsus marinus ATCC 50983]